MKTTTLLFVLLIVGLAGCKSNRQVADKTADEDLISMANIESGYYSGYEDPGQFLITTDEEWANTWKLLNRYNSPAPALPEVDFNKQSVVAVFMGMKNSGGFGIQIEETRISGDTLKVKIIHFKPGKDCMTTSALTQPFHLVAIDKATINQTAFSIEERINDCE